MRQRVVAAAAAFSASIAVYCLGVAAASGARGPVGGFLAAAIATAALVRAARGGSPDQPPLRLCPRRGVLVDGDGEARFVPVGVTRNVICLVRPGVWGHHPIWRDAVGRDGFRRVAAFALWRRRTATEPADAAELIPRKAVTEGRSVPRTGRPRNR